MALDSTKTFVVESGLEIEEGPIITGGAASPVGLDFPANTVYYQTLGGGLVSWFKTGPNVSDWVNTDPKTATSIQSFPFLNTDTVVVEHNLGRYPLVQIKKDVIFSAVPVGLANEKLSNEFSPGVFLGDSYSISTMIPITEVLELAYNDENTLTITFVGLRTGQVLIIG